MRTERPDMNESAESVEERLTQMYELASEVMGLNPEYQPGPQSVAAIRVYLKLYSLYTGDLQKIREWMQTPNESLGGVPGDQVDTEEGLDKILEYLNTQ
jgi:hypothetical protein